jgi:hypothetical protein
MVMNRSESVVINKLDVLGAVTKANFSDENPVNDDVALLNKTMQKILKIEQRSNAYLRKIEISADDFKILQRYGVEACKKNNDPMPVLQTKQKYSFRSFLMHLLSFSKI